MRGTFANVKLQNKARRGKRGGWTRDFIDDEIKAVYDAAEHYQGKAPIWLFWRERCTSGSSRLIWQGADAPGHSCRIRRKLRANPPFKSYWYGYPSFAV